MYFLWHYFHKLAMLCDIITTLIQPKNLFDLHASNLSSVILETYCMCLHWQEFKRRKNLEKKVVLHKKSTKKYLEKKVELNILG